MVTHNGLNDFKDERKSLLKDAQFIVNMCNTPSGHLGDVVSGIRTIISSMEIKADSLWKLFEEQKALTSLTY